MVKKQKQQKLNKVTIAITITIIIFEFILTLFCIQAGTYITAHKENTDQYELTILIIFAVSVIIVLHATYLITKLYITVKRLEHEQK